MLRYARYAAAVLFALLAVGFVALWVRSHSFYDALQGPIDSKRFVGISSHQGLLSANLVKCEEPLPRLEAAGEGWSVTTNNLTPSTSYGWGLGFSAAVKRGLVASEFGVTFPHWFLAALSLGLAVLFAFKRTWRYSLRTILVATTLLAGLLGLAVWAVY